MISFVWVGVMPKEIESWVLKKTIELKTSLGPSSIGAHGRVFTLFEKTIMLTWTNAFLIFSTHIWGLLLHMC